MRPDISVAFDIKALIPGALRKSINRENLMLAYQRVVENKGAAGVDNLSVMA